MSWNVANEKILLDIADLNEWHISDEVLYRPHFPLNFFWLSWDLNLGLPVEKLAFYPLLHELTLRTAKMLANIDTSKNEIITRVLVI